MVKRIFFLIVSLVSHMLVYAQTNTNAITLDMDTSGYIESSSVRSFGGVLQKADTLPSIKGDLSVNSIGGLNYTIGIDAVKGVNGFSPNMALVYDSQSNNGIAGWGWSIVGISKITIGSKSKELDGLTIGAQHDGYDPYYLDGGRLLTTDNKKFETYLYSKLIIQKDVEANYSFVVKYPNGKIAKYKELLAGEHFISTMQDAYGNTVDYNYRVSEQSVYLFSVNYGGNVEGAPHQYRILFNYKKRKSKVGAYNKGNRLETGEILNSITVNDFTTTDRHYRKYWFTYDYIHQNRIERLVQVEVENNENSLLPALRFEYTTTKSKAKAIRNEKKLNIRKDFTELGDVAIGDYYGDGDLFPIYEIVLPKEKGKKYEKGERNIQLWNPKGKDIESYKKSRKLYAGKVLVDTIINGKKERVVSNGDFLITIELNNAPNKPSYTQATYDLKFYDLTKSNAEPEVVKFHVTDKKGGRTFLIGDFNNDGLIDMLFVQRATKIPTKEGWKTTEPQYLGFAEIGKHNRKNKVIHLDDIDIDYPIDLSWGNYYPIDFDGDGVPEFLDVSRSIFNESAVSLYKLELKQRRLRKVDIGITNLKDFKKDTPIIFGDFNGDGLIDFITPQTLYSLDDMETAPLLEKIVSDKQYWWLYTSTGKKYEVTQLDFSAQNLGYIVPSQRNIIDDSTLWAKIWSGKMDSYSHTEYASSNIIAMDVDGDGKTDLVSFRKYGRITYKEKLTNSVIDLKKDSHRPIREGVDFHIVVPDESRGSNKFRLNTLQNSFVFTSNNTNLPELKGKTEYDEEFRNRYFDGMFSPISLLYGKSDYNALNSYKNGLVVYDAFDGYRTEFIIDNDGFSEGRLEGIDNGSGVTQRIEYRPLSEYNNTDKERIYTYDQTLFAYPYNKVKAFGTHYLVHKVHSLLKDKILSREYRYHNGVQHLEGKGFLGFQQTKSSEIYEGKYAIDSKGKGAYGVKDFGRGMFWRVNTFDPYLDNVQISSTYGSLNEKAMFSRTTSYNEKVKVGKSYIILTMRENEEDYLGGFTTDKKYSYYFGGDVLLHKLETKYSDIPGIFTEEYTYLADFSNRYGNYFHGKIGEIKKVNTVGNSTFQTMETMSYTPEGDIEKKEVTSNNMSTVTTSYKYSKYGNNLETKIMAKGLSKPLVTKFEYDNTNRFLIGTVNADGTKTSSVINKRGEIVTSIDELKRKTHYNYDSWGNLNKVTDYLGNTVLTKKSSNTNIPNARYKTNVISSDGSEVITYYDMLDQAIRIETKTLKGKYAISEKEYDIFGNVVRYSQPYYQGETVKWNKTVYDRLNRPTEFIDFTGKTITTCYEKSKVTVEDGHKKSIKWLNSLGQTIKSEDSGGVIVYSYHANGVLKEADYDGIKTKIEIDGWGNKSKLIDPSAGSYTYVYDDLSRLKKTINPQGGISTYTYDDYGKILTETTKSPKEETDLTVNYTYHKDFKVVEELAGDYNGQAFSYNTKYDVNGHVIQEKEKTPKFEYTKDINYDKKGRVSAVESTVKVSDSSLELTTKVTNVYEDNKGGSGALIAQKDGNGKLIWEIGDVTAFGAMAKMTYGNGTKIEQKYDGHSHLENITHMVNNIPVLNIGYIFDPKKGVLLDRKDNVFDNQEQFSYDDLDRLLKETTNGKILNEYTYDVRGRMTSNTEIGKYTYNDKNYQLKDISFNDNGAKMLEERGFANVKYNAFKSPIRIELEDKDKIDYEFSILKSRYANYFGNLDSKEKRPIQKYYSADKKVEIEVTTDNVRLIMYVTGDPYSANYMEIKESKGGNAKGYYLHRDNQGTIVGISDTNGEIVEQRHFDAWGNLKGVRIANEEAKINELGWNTSLLLDRGYTGHEHLYTVGLIHMNGRVYDPKLRRFLSPDNFVLDVTNTQSYDRYAYVLNNPLLYTDPSGEEGLSVVAVVGISVGIAILTNTIANLVEGVPFWYGIGKSAVMGGVSGAISFGIGSIAIEGSGAFFAQAMLHGASGGIMSEIGGGDFGSGFASGAISSLIASGVKAIGNVGFYMDEDYLIYNSFANRNPGLFKAIVISSGGLSGGISSSIAGGNFWKGMQQGLITSGLNHVMHEIGNDSPFDDGGGKDKANVYIETDGVGHVYVEIDGTVYSYGRYNGSYSPSSGKFGPYGDGVLLRLDGDNATNFIAERTAKYPTSTYSVDVDGAKVKAYYNKLYNSGKSLQGKEGFYKYGRVVDTYTLMGPGGNNCTTITYKALNYGGANMGAPQTPAGMLYNFKQAEYIRRGYNPGLRGLKL